MAAIRIYEPALCCESGVCGTDTDASLVTVTADVRRLKDLGADIERHNLATDPTAFTTDETVRGFMHTVGSKGLPLTVVDGVTVATGTYPSRDELLGFAGLGDSSNVASKVASTVASQVEPARSELGLTAKSGGCCGGASGCC
ncbi:MULTISPECIES: arsenite efflux transporter metallochaperone ArsD [Cryobacterium]|uniref:Arsenite efflux transporter metallochaperone ArsD n=1 Tax=Cryobacterium glucosi TaxID=1259175 RepID=A0ABY2IL15_9MICO|nr:MULTISPECIES: arsenite efflux transporter metallochaperone ArsD [Cryobacterium]MDY7526943.1 arsenite efflux transporter metallochaperone ArsD [Cryobacterium sp. 10C2]MEB0004998.1 arsenite efflux transporter metallochaperone ArsD [Cryobacterium sp. RTC2.1]MEB0201165.1 arsenite efflux transporter metallochaperone ArsD [Cryobacterium sp. 5I3]MEB0288340.1 arsenite efflux transporter metallochaperone ArsD [Cryobacterium sp. 10S3]MEB0292478.1 arsenite efflux transporter metallochaperone ArsD [Cry